MAAVKDPATEFTAQYLAVYHLHSLARTEPGRICARTIAALESLLLFSPHAREHQGYFLMRETADALAAIVSCGEPGRSSQAFDSLLKILGRVQGHPHRAAAEALGALPFTIRGPKLPVDEGGFSPGRPVRFRELLGETGIKLAEPPAFYGRSLVAGIAGSRRFLVVKLARPEDTPETLVKEPLWMGHLRGSGYRFPVRFDVPVPLFMGGRFLFQLEDLPVKAPPDHPLHRARMGVGFVADREYFTYPNAPEFVRRAGFAAFWETMLRNAWILGKLTGMGIVHSAPIPLFHNRMQQNRRRDHGLYEWVRAGRLDRWLASCRFPNLGLTGIRDFEHLSSYQGESRGLYRPIGTHFLSLLLVAGSWFRNRRPDRIGLDSEGRPVDARDLFDKARLGALVRALFKEYYRGFTGKSFQEELPLDIDRLCERMVDEMGVDRYMEEILRAADQERMSDADFKAFLYSKGFAPDQISGIARGKTDISIQSGPHLGGFNRKISLPEMIEAVETMAALCIGGRYRQEGRRFSSMNN